MAAICEIDVDEAKYLGTEQDGVYFDADEGPDGWYVSTMVDCNSGHFCEPLITDDGPYPTRGQGLVAGLCGAAEWLVSNDILRGWRGDFARMMKAYKRLG